MAAVYIGDARHSEINKPKNLIYINNIRDMGGALVGRPPDSHNLGQNQDAASDR